MVTRGHSGLGDGEGGGLVGGQFGVAVRWAAEDLAYIVGEDGVASGTDVGLAR